jgi:translation initiation factor 2B subunit (eIF-2B alpha/beta/delta family)
MLPQEIYQKIEEIRTDKVRGASELATKAVGVIKLLAEKRRAEKEEDLLKELREVELVLVGARPEMAPIASNVARVVYQVLEEYKAHPAKLKNLINQVAERRIKEYKEESLKAAEKGAWIIKDGERIMTCSYSSTICNVFRMAVKQKKRMHILIAESKFGDKTYGKIMLDKLNLPEYTVELIPDESIEKNILRVDKILVGADSVLANGSLINGVPTLLLVRVARKFSIPFYSVCETSKFDLFGNLRKRSKIEPGFDLIPPELITAFITEEGLIKPQRIGEEIKKRKRWTRQSPG